MLLLPATPPDPEPASPPPAADPGPPVCPSCGRPAAALFHPVLPVPGEHLEDRARPLVCPACCPRPDDETKV